MDPATLMLPLRVIQLLDDAKRRRYLEAMAVLEDIESSPSERRLAEHTLSNMRHTLRRLGQL
ncbi:MAG: hypothetical protein ACYDCS_09095 [Candidatus Dormibacteria bacterium]